MTSPGRRLALCAQPVPLLTGLDFVQVLDPADQRVLRVFFVVEPDLTVPPLVAPAAVPPLAPNQTEGPAVVAALPVTVQTEAAGLPATVLRLRWRRVRSVVDTRVVLEVTVSEPGGFEPYRLTVTHAQLDPLSSSMLFDFKQACETGFDCEAVPDCPDEALPDVPIDYLARDFHSLRRALLDFAAQRHPDWKEPVEADFGTLMLEVMAAMGDHFAYQQDRIDAETRFASATQRASMFAHAKLVDYRPGRGQPARGPALFTAVAGATLPVDCRVWARVGGGAPVVYSTLAPLWVEPFWNSLPAHRADSQADCVPHGATSLMLRSSPAVPTQTPPGVSRAQFLVGKRVLLLSDPADPAVPRRALPVTITALNEFSDPLVTTGGVPTFVTEIHWADAEATAVGLPFDGLGVGFNVVDIAAGERVLEHFRIGEETAMVAHHPGLDAVLAARMATLAPAIEREGPLEREGSGRDIVMRHGLAATEGASLRHSAAGRPDVELLEVRPPAVLPLVLPVDDAELFALFVQDPAADWRWVEDLLGGDLDSEHYTLEPGLWRTVKRHQLPLGWLAFRDYAAAGGWTLRFASGDFGRAPPDGAVLRVAYRTDPGVVANVPSFTLAITPQPGSAPDPLGVGIVSAVANPLPLAGAVAEESLADIRISAPQAFRARPRRAVLPQDHADILGLLPFVQRANAVTHWTGSWSTDFVAVDPLGSVALTDEQRASVEAEIDCIRLATRDVRRVDAEYLDIDLDIALCVAPEAYAGEVIEAVLVALRSPGYFAPDHFSFGTPLVRSALEAAVQAVPGVRFVDAIRIRVRGRGDWRPFSEAELRPAAHQIIRLQDDPDRAALGVLSVHSDRVPATGGP